MADQEIQPATTPPAQPKQPVTPPSPTPPPTAAEETQRTQVASLPKVKPGTETTATSEHISDIKSSRDAIIKMQIASLEKLPGDNQKQIEALRREMETEPKESKGPVEALKENFTDPETGKFSAGRTAATVGKTGYDAAKLIVTKAAPTPEGIAEIPADLVHGSAGVVQSVKNKDALGAMYSGAKVIGGITKTAGTIISPAAIPAAAVFDGFEDARKENKPLAKTAESAKEAYAEGKEKFGNGVGGTMIAGASAASHGAVTFTEKAADTTFDTGKNVVKGAINAPKELWKFVKRPFDKKEDKT